MITLQKNYFFAPMAIASTKTTILKDVAKYYGLSTWDLKQDTQEQAVTYPRYIAMSLMWYNNENCQVERNTTITAIGKLFGRTHGTVIHGFKTIANDLQFSKVNRETIRKICNSTGIDFELFKDFMIKNYGKSKYNKSDSSLRQN